LSGVEIRIPAADDARIQSPTNTERGERAFVSTADDLAKIAGADDAAHSLGSRSLR
jgi:hypothetical protein